MFNVQFCFVTWGHCGFVKVCHFPSRGHPCYDSPQWLGMIDKCSTKNIKKWLLPNNYSECQGYSLNNYSDMAVSQNSVPLVYHLSPLFSPIIVSCYPLHCWVMLTHSHMLCCVTTQDCSHQSNPDLGCVGANHPQEPTTTGDLEHHCQLGINGINQH